jgi:hypothetical protein
LTSPARRRSTFHEAVNRPLQSYRRQSGTIQIVDLRSYERRRTARLSAIEGNKPLACLRRGALRLAGPFDAQAPTYPYWFHGLPAAGHEQAAL